MPGYQEVPILNGIPNDNLVNKGIASRALPQKTAKIAFDEALTNSVSAWGTIIAAGSGMSVNQTGGNLVITSGTTVAAEQIIRSNDTWEGGIRLRARSTLSQRIANQNFFVELVDVIGDGLVYNITSATTVVVTIPSNPFTAVNIGQSMYLGAFSGTGTFLGGRYPIASIAGNNVTFTVAGFAAGTGTCSAFGWNYYQLLYTGATATQLSFDAQRKGYSSGAVNATINTTASPGHLAILSNNDSACTLADQLVATNTGIAQTIRASRTEFVPDDAYLKLQIRTLNGSVAPASSTTWTINFITITNFAAQDISIQDIKPMSSHSGLPIDIVKSIVIAVSQSGAWTASIGNTANTTPILANPLIPVVSTTGDTGAKTATGNGATLTNVNAKGALIVLNLGAVSGTTPTLVLKLQGSSDGGTNWVDIPNAFTATLTAGGLYAIMIYPGIAAISGTASAGSVTQVNSLLPRNWRVVWTIGGTTPSFTITNIQVSYVF